MKKRTIAVALALMMTFVTGCSQKKPVSADDNVVVIQEKKGGAAGDTSSSSSTTDSSNAADISTTEAGIETQTPSENLENGEQMATENIEDEKKELSVWYPYWDNATAEAELDTIGDDLNKLCFFAAYYDVEEKPFIGEGIEEIKNNLKDGGKLDSKEIYLTFVNDRLLEEGSSLKDTALLYDLIGSGDKAEAHADDIIRLSENFGCDGIEIDYEAIKGDTTLWQLFNDFIKILSVKCDEKSLKLRVVFEPSAPLEDYQWPQNAEYVMMCYNLCGYGTEPGPKANTAFIEKMAKKMKVLPGEINLAFANGGFDFANDGNITQIDYADAKALMSTYGGEAVRDNDSHDLVYSYVDDGGISHEVWFADKETIDQWVKTAENFGIKKVSVWRLGGNIE